LKGKKEEEEIKEEEEEKEGDGDRLSVVHSWDSEAQLIVFIRSTN